MTLVELNTICENTLIGHLGIVFTEITDKYLKARMHVDKRTTQPMGLLHGGASLALAETVGSVGSYLMIDRSKFNVVGIQVNGNHIGSARSGYVEAIGIIVHKGTRTHVWDITIEDEQHNPVSVCRVTNMLLEK
jgi:1,4-dihydroxy-2-naphthoyl-CoA hydrolase